LLPSKLSSGRFSLTSTSRQTSRLTRAWRITCVAAHVVQAAGVAGVGYPWMKPARRRLALQRWSAKLVRHLAARLTVHGEPPHYGTTGITGTPGPAPFMLVSNHVSWLDIFVINAAVPTRFVAKSEVRRWPLVGWLCVKADTLFIQRERPRDLARLDEAIVSALRDSADTGTSIGVFLEGTTTDGSEVLPFHSSLLRPAQQVNVPIHPVAIQYRRNDGSICTEAAYDGDKTLLDTLRLILTQPEIHVHVHFLPPLAATGVHRKALAQQVRALIVQRLYP
jgi:1-acyl-sn-glycerol-3-phosphate acyltransferase